MYIACITIFIFQENLCDLTSNKYHQPRDQYLKSQIALSFLKKEYFNSLFDGPVFEEMNIVDGQALLAMPL